MLNIFFIHQNSKDKEYFSPFFLELDQQLINLQFFNHDQQSSENQLTIIVVRSLSELAQINLNLSRRLYVAVSFETISATEKLEFYQNISS